MRTASRASFAVLFILSLWSDAAVSFATRPVHSSVAVPCMTCGARSQTSAVAYVEGKSPTLLLRGGNENVDESRGDAPNVSPALTAMRAITEAAKSGEQDLVDAYALLQSLKDKGERIGLEIYHEMLRLCIEVVRENKAATLDGERILAEILSEGYVPTYDTYELQLAVIEEGAKQDPQRGFLSEGFELLEQMEAAGLIPRNETYEAYNRIYEQQWPNVVEIDDFEFGWCVMTEQEDRLWRGDPELGIPPDTSCDPRHRVHVNDIKDIPLTEVDKAFYARWENYDSEAEDSGTPSSSSF
mmetsp:Transcript_1854/g.4141  ORF Transcript_1854/g.4141 Transcript_1854/m.4141 type:complete len:299 (+) Transcript_1854:99-995(+)